MRDDGNGGEGGRVDGAADPFGYVLALQLSRWTASCATSYILNYVGIEYLGKRKMLLF